MKRGRPLAKRIDLASAREKTIYWGHTHGEGEQEFLASSRAAGLRDALASNLKRAHEIGAVLRLLATSTKYREEPVSKVMGRVISAVTLSMCRLILDANDLAVAYAGWASLTDEGAQAIQGGHTVPLDLWNAGKTVCLTDWFAYPDSVDRLMEALQKSLDIVAQQIVVMPESGLNMAQMGCIDQRLLAKA